MQKIPVCEPLLGGSELKLVMETIETNWISSSGKFIKSFEESFSRYVGVKHGIGTTSGTTGLHLAMVAAGIKAGDEVIIPNFTMIASAFAVCYTGATPVFVDAEPRTWTIDVNKIEGKITPKTKAIMAVHIYGHPADMEALRAVSKRKNLLLIEDAAEGIGAEVNGKRCGSLSDVAAFSFYANKNITTGEGGMVVTNSDELAKRSRYFKNLCFPMDGQRTYVHEEIGFNYRMNNIQAAIGVAQMEKIDDYVRRRRENALVYNSQLAGVEQLERPVEESWAKNCYWMYGVVLSERASISREALMAKLAEDGIETRPFFTPMHEQPALRKFGADCGGSYPVSSRLGKQGFYLPSSTHLATEQINRVCQSLKNRLR